MDEEIKFGDWIFVDWESNARMEWINAMHTTHKFYKDKIKSIIKLIEQAYKDKANMPNNIKSALIKLELLKTVAEKGWRY